MQNRYACDIGDYVKLSILRRLSPGYRLGVAWWLYPDQSHNADGKHIKYLQNVKKWRKFDPDLFENLRLSVETNNRNVISLQQNLPSDTIFVNSIIPDADIDFDLRGSLRNDWFWNAKEQLKSAELIFVDPDNGIEPKSFRLTRKGSGKSIRYQELIELGENKRPIVVYHHQTRVPHKQELTDISSKLKERGFATVDALRTSPYSSRFFFLLNAQKEMRVRAERLANDWPGKIYWFPDTTIG